MGIKERIGVVGEIRNLPERISNRAFKFFEYGVEIQIRKSSQLPLSEREKALKSIISKVQKLFHPANTLHRQHKLLGLCYQVLDDPENSLLHFKKAVSLHPYPTNNQYLKNTLNLYLVTLDKISSLPQKDKQRVFTESISDLESFLKFQVFEPNIHNFIALCYREAGNQIMALNHSKLALELAGADNPKKDIFEKEFLNDLRRLIQANIPKLDGKRRAQALQTIATALSWTTHLLTNCPELKYRKEISHEINTATSWLLKFNASIIISEIGPQTPQTS